MSFTVAFTVSGLRQKYLRKCLDHWANVRGVQDAHLLFCIEPMRPHQHGFPVAEFKQFCQRSFRNVTVAVNDERLGCFSNTRRAMSTAFAAGAQFAILCEEDLVVADDTLEYFAWCQRYQGDPAVQAVCGHAFHGNGLPKHVVRRPWFSPILWGTWEDRWRSFIEPGWGGAQGNPDAWDANLRERIAAAGKASIFPAWSRSQHIGEISTLTPGSLAVHFYNQSISQCFTARYGRVEYAELPGEDLVLTV